MVTKKKGHREPLKSLSGSNLKPLGMIEKSRIRKKKRQIQNEQKKSFSSSSAITVAIRVRPLLGSNDVEKNSNNCINSIEETLRISDPKSSESKSFTYDRIFNNNRIENRKNDQNEICGSLADELVKKSSFGYNTCCFCYGQTGSGKTYTMYGTKSNPGILQRVCSGLFKFIRNQENYLMNDIDSDCNFSVNVSMVEIYQEHLTDLLYDDQLINHSKKGKRRNRNRPALKIWENGKISGLTHISCQSSEEILKTVEKGNEKKRIGETHINNKSSRSHTIVQIEFKQSFYFMGTKIKSVESKTNLIDLAGSERIKKSKTTGERLKEGIAINKSLTHLGIVIRDLAEKSVIKDEGKKKSFHIKFRDSKLTFLLKNSLSGNSKTYVIVNVSPSSNNYDETKSSLEFASRVKQIELNAKVNEDIELQKQRNLIENEKIKEMQNKIITLNQSNMREIESMQNHWKIEFAEYKRVCQANYNNEFLDLEERYENELNQLLQQKNKLQHQLNSLRK